MEDSNNEILIATDGDEIKILEIALEEITLKHLQKVIDLTKDMSVEETIEFAFENYGFDVQLTRESILPEFSHFPNTNVVLFDHYREYSTSVLNKIYYWQTKKNVTEKEYDNFYKKHK